MAIRSEVRQFIALGPFPPAKHADPADLERRGALLRTIQRPVNQDEAVALLECFGPDECFGLAWTLLHLIETAPGGLPWRPEPDATENEWVRHLWDRSNRDLGAG